jgi:tRNA(Ile)-lysidine synthetase-like protein
VLLMGGIHRKIRKLQNAAHIPTALRARIPLLCDSHGVLWVPFVGMRDGFSRGNTGDFCLTLEIFSDGENFDER